MSAPVSVGVVPPSQARAVVALPEERQPTSGLLGLNFSDPVRRGLMSAGFGMMASTSPNFGVALGQGGLAGVKAYEDALEQQREEGIERAKLAAVQARALAPKMTAMQSNYLTAKKEGFAGSFMDYLGATKAGAPTTTVNMPKMESAYDKELGGFLAKEFVESQKSASTAVRNLSQMAIMDKALSDPNLYTGTGGETVQAIKKAASSLFGMDVKGLTSGELMQDLGKNVALSYKENLPGPMSNSDRDFLVSMAPNLSKTPDGNRTIIQIAMADKEWQIGRAKAIREYAARNAGRLDPDVYEIIAEVDARAQAKFAELFGRLRSLPEARRAPTVGTPLESMSTEELEAFERKMMGGD
jgi:hypothetical protein